MYHLFIKNKIIFLLIFIILPIIKPNTITIKSPPLLISLFNNEKNLDLEYATFGIIPYRFSARGEILISNEDNNLSCKKHTKPIDYNSKIIKTNFKILLVKRGECTFVTKARNAQEAGANMLIIIDDVSSNIHNYIIADDGTGYDIHIPTAMISKEDGEKIFNYIIENKNINVYVDVDFSIKNSRFIELETFFSSSEKKAYELLIHLSEYFSEFDQQINYKPRYVTHRSPSYSENNRNKISNCVSGGLYCYFPKQTTVVQDGELIILEDLRQKCIFNEAIKLNNIQIFFNYIENFYMSCVNINKPDFSENCSNTEIKNAGLNIDQINNCIANSFGVSKFSNTMLQNDNNILSEDYESQSKYYLNSFPAVVINKKPIEGIIKESKIIEQICYYVDERPDFCEYYLKNESKSNRNDFSFWFIISILVLLLILVIFCIIFWCKKYIHLKVYQRIHSDDIDINGRINNVINNYFAIKESSKK